MDKAVLEKIFEGLDMNLVSEELRQKVSQMIESVVKTRVEALTHEFAEKEAIFIEEVGKVKLEYRAREKALTAQIAQKEQILEDEAMSFAEKATTSLREKEEIMVSEVENYRQHVENLVSEEASAYRDHLEQIVKEESKNYMSFIESIALEEASNHKLQQDTLLANEVSAFKKELVEQVSEFFESELTKSIPQEIMEAAVKLSVYEPLVENMINVFGQSYVKLDTTSYEVIKEARKENENLSQSVNAKVKDNVRLQARVKELEKKSKLAELTEGMTSDQKKKATQLMENYNLEELETKFSHVKDIVVENSVKTAEIAKPIVSDKQQLISEATQKKIEKLKSHTGGLGDEMAGYVARLRRQSH